MSLGEAINPVQAGLAPAPAERPVAAHKRRVAAKKPDTGDDSVPFFDETRVPVEVIEMAAVEAVRLAPDEFDVITYKHSYRLHSVRAATSC